MEPSLLVDGSDAAVVTLTLNRPGRRNALDVELLERLREAVVAESGRAGRRVIVLRGAGVAFCAGLDFREAADPAVAHRSAEALAGVYRAIVASPLVTVAAAHGAAMGGGAGLVAACDFAIVGDDLRLAYPEVHRGLVAALVTCLLRRRVSDGVVRELVLLGQTIGASEALGRGLVNRVVAAGELEGRVGEFAREVCRGAPGAVARTKRLLNELAPVEASIEVALRVHLEARNSEEAKEGVAAFLEKRAPRWGDS